MTAQLDTKARAATCRRCGEMVLAATAGGVRVAADPMPLHKHGRMAALMDNRTLYVLNHRKLRIVTLDLKYLDDKVVLASHGCGCSAVDVDAFEEAEPENPTQAPVTLGGPSDGSHPPDALAGAQTGSQGPSRPSLAVPANPRPSEFSYDPCDRCGLPIDPRDLVKVTCGSRTYFKYHWSCT